MPTLDLATLRVKITSDSSDYKQGVKQSREETRKFGVDAKQLIGVATAGAFAAAGAAAVKFANESIAEFQDFDRGMREVFTLMPDISQAAMDQMSADVIDFSAEVGRTTDQTVPALYQAISAGVPPENVFDFMQIASDAALGGVTDLETAVDGISSAVNAYGAEALSAQEASDLMFTAVKGGKTDFDQLSRSLFQVLPTAAALDVEFGNVTAALATLTAQGVPTTVATTQLRQLLVELSKEGSKAAATFEDLAGESFREFIASGGNLQEALQVMEGGAAGLNVGLNDLFGSVEAGSAALGLTGSAAEKYTAELEAAEAATGATAAAAEVMAGSLEFAEQRAAAVEEAFKLAAGEGLAPFKQELIEIKTEALSAATALLTARDKVEGIVEANEAAASSTADMIAEAKEIGEVLESFTIFQRILASATGASTPMKERLAEIGEELAKQAGSWDEYNELLDQAFEGQVSVALGGEKLMISNAALGNTVIGNVADLEALIGTVDLNRQASIEAAKAAGLYTEASIATGRAFQEAREENDQYTTSLEAVTIATIDASDPAYIYASAIDAVGEASLDYEVTAADVAEAEARRQEATEAATEAAEAARVAEEELTAALSNHFDQALTAGDQTTTFESQLYEAAAAADINAEALVILAGNTGEFTEAEIEAAFQAALMAANIDTLVEAMKRGDITADEATAALDLLKESETLTAERAIALAGSVDGVTGSLSQAEEQARNVANEINNIPENVTTTVTVNYREGNRPPGVPGGVQEFQHGGYTGNLGTNEAAGIVHGGEFVFSAPAVAAIGAASLDALHNAGRGGAGLGSTVIVNVDARGARDPQAIRAAGRAGVAEALTAAGIDADILNRMR